MRTLREQNLLMNRRSFLKGLGILAGASLIPDWFGKNNPAEPEGLLLDQPDHFKTPLPNGYKDKFVNHMSIQRKNVKITGECTGGPVLIHWKDNSGNNWTVVHNETWDGPLENYENRPDCSITRLNK